MGCRRRAAVIGARLRRRGSSRGGWARRRGWGAAIGRGTANGVVSEGGGAAEGRVDGGGELAGVLRSGGGVLGRRSGEHVKEQAEWNAGVLVMLVRARGEGGGLCLGRATATARWRPAGARCCVARQGKVQREAKSGGGGRARRVGRFCKQEVAGLALHSSGDRRSREAGWR